MAKKSVTLASTPVVAEIILPTASTALTVIQHEAPVEAPVEASVIVEEPSVERATLSVLTMSGARVTPQSIIHPNLWGRERWFAKKRLHSYTTNMDGSVSLILPTSELTYRDSVLSEALCSVAAYSGGYSLTNKGGEYDRLSTGYEIAE